MATKDIILRVTADIAAYQQNLAQLPGVTEKAAAKSALKMQQEFYRAQQAAENALQSTSKQSQTAATGVRGLGSAMAGLGQQASDVASQLTTGTNPLTILIQQGPQALGALQGVSGGFGILAGVVAAVASVAVPLVGIYKSLHEEQSALTRASEAMGSSYTALRPILDATRSATIDLKVATGELSKEQADMLDKLERIRVAYTDAITVPLQQISKLRTEQQSLSTAIADAAEKYFPEFGRSVNVAWLALDGFTRSTEEINAEIALFQARIDEAAKRTEEAKKKTEEAAKATEAKRRRDESARKEIDRVKDALRAQEEALRASIAAMDEDKRLTDQYRSGLEQIENAARSAYMAQLEGVAAIVAKRELELQQLEELYQKTLALASSDAERLALIEQYEAARVAITERAEAEIRKEKEKTAKAESDADKKRLATARTIASKIASMTGQLSSTIQENGQRSLDVATALAAQLEAGEKYYTEAQEKELLKRIKAQEKAAQRAFRAAQAAAIAEATINTAVGITEAIPNPFLMALAAAAGATQIAAIGAQKARFHSGKMPDEVTITRREAQGGILPPAAVQALGPQNVQRALNGQSPTDVSFKISYRREDFTRFIKDYSKSGGPITLTQQTGTSVGHRSNRRGDNG